MAVPNVQELTDEQLEELISQQQESAPEAANALQQLLDHRRSVQSEVEKLREKASKSTGGRRAGTTKPRERHEKAAVYFMQDQAKVDRWNGVVERAKNGSAVEMTGEIIQIAIAAYYAQRKRDVAEAEAANAKSSTAQPAQPAIVENDEPTEESGDVELAGVAHRSSFDPAAELDDE